MRFSVDAASEATCRRIRAGDFERLPRNVETYVASLGTVPAATRKRRAARLEQVVDQDLTAIVTSLSGQALIGELLMLIWPAISSGASGPWVGRGREDHGAKAVTRSVFEVQLTRAPSLSLNIFSRGN